MKQRFSVPDHDLCWRAVDKLLENKWRRNDVLTFIEEWTGHSRYELYEKALENGGNIPCGIKYEITDELAYTAEDMVDGIVHGVDPEFNPVSIRPRMEGASGKVRNIAYLDMRHQLLGHIVKEGLEELFKARILPTQHASMPGHGQTGLTRQVRRMLNRKLGIQCYIKTDCMSAYTSTKYGVIIDILKKEIPRARWIIACMRTLEKYAPDGHLIIGGYLDAWLFNFVMSYAIRYVMSLEYSRRGKRIEYVTRCVTYMDDCLLLGSSIKGVARGANEMAAWLWINFQIQCRTTTGVIKLASIAEEKSRKKSTSPASRHAAMIDMGGYKIGRSHITLRRRNVKKILRCFDRAWLEYEATGTIKRQRSCQIISRNGMPKNSDSYKLCHNHHVYKLLKIAKKIQGHWARVKRLRQLEVLTYVTEKHRKQCAALCGSAG